MKESRCDKCDKEFASKEALDMHNRSKHPILYKGPLVSNRQKKKIKNYAIIVIILLAVGGMYYWWTTPPANAPIMEITPASYDFGMVSQAKGVVSTTMKISNTGSKDLILDNMDTSCGCTSASIISDGKEGAKFSMAMHGTNPKNWQEIIKPGESVQLKVYYDPNVHKDMRGAVTRSVMIYSNMPRQSKTEVTIYANQVD